MTLLVGQTKFILVKLTSSATIDEPINPFPPSNNIFIFSIPKKYDDKR
jgi:hypothetical protein